MKKLSASLELDYESLVQLKDNLSNLEELIQEPIGDVSDSVNPLEQYELKMEMLRSILPKLSLFDIQRMEKRSPSLSNSKLFLVFVRAFEQHNQDLASSKLSLQSTKEG